jgi:A/G-specific adenine glycosylase
MELGALVCSPRVPACDACPVASLCRAHASGNPERFPAKRHRPAPSPHRVVAFVVEQQGTFLLRQRPEGQVNALLWEFPNQEIAPTDPVPGEWLCTLRHSITRHRITLEARRVGLEQVPQPLREMARWSSKAELGRLAFTAAHRRIANRLRAPQPHQAG